MSSLPLHQFEKLDGALSAFLLCDERMEARMESRLFDAALDCGMPYDEPSVRDWAVERVTASLTSAQEG